MTQDENAVVQDPIQTPAEEMIPKARVNELVHERTRAVADKLQAKHEAELNALREEHQKQQPSMGGMVHMSEDQLHKVIQDNVKKGIEEHKVSQQDQLDRELGDKIMRDFHSKLVSSNHPDLVKRVSELGSLDKIWHIVEMANAMDNTADIMDDLHKNPSKIGNITILAHTNPNLAVREMQNLSHSIKLNQKAANHQHANSPLDHITPSPTAGTDNGSMSIRDLRSQDWMRA